ncbi:hypothetical protein BH760_gp38 [Gordonia phage Splinter]|uniref:Uncharacterized protein n=2 Tax=Vendettavirus vendetta TaxID=2049886 RepID=A0A160DD31_9CAUD|nr:hypothetical protein BH795_gp38 [Gordonia phage Vendetta]YP_009275427.1 hypothetical protein BH760_gp38 [Gordonia phage Splinter]ANA85620.1 hypothetical protein PBI_VENDETTA_73 [Gordonia phage Vendetta]ANA85699.1 hypothetical protein PBI_SPLINTER_73 [Gordonia phage Splinter]
MKTFEFEDWAGDKLEASPARHDSGLVEVAIYGPGVTAGVELPHGAIPNLIAYLYGNLPASERTRVLDGLQRVERIGPNG